MPSIEINIEINIENPYSAGLSRQVSTVSPGSTYTSNEGQQDRHAQQLFNLYNRVPVSKQLPEISHPANMTSAREPLKLWLTSC